MHRFTILIGICLLMMLGSAGLLVRKILSLTPDHAAGGPPALPGALQRAKQEQEVIERKAEIVGQKQQLAGFKLADSIARFQVHDRQFSEAIDDLEAKLKNTQAPLRSAAQKLNTAFTQLAVYRRTFEAEQQAAAHMSETAAGIGGHSPEPPDWNPAAINNLVTARGEFEVAVTAFKDGVEQARVASNQSLSSLQLQVLSSLDALAGVQAEALSNQAEMLQLYDQLIKFVSRFGRLGSGPVALPPGVEPGTFTGEHFRSLMQAVGDRVRAGISADAVAERARQNVQQDSVIQRAVANYNNGLND